MTTKLVLMKIFKRRDAIINAIALRIYSVKNLTNINVDNIYDPHNGLNDIKNKI